jgi:hypothetical protein
MLSERHPRITRFSANWRHSPVNDRSPGDRTRPGAKPVANAPGLLHAYDMLYI